MNLEVRRPSRHQSPNDHLINASCVVQVLFISESLTGNSTLRQIAIAHADKTMQNHIRDDGVYICLLSTAIVEAKFDRLHLSRCGIQLVHGGCDQKGDGPRVF